jgi:hypothetical protein
VNTVEQVFAGDPEDLAFFRSWRRRATSKLVEIEAPYTLWQHVFVELERLGVDARGRKARGIPARVVSALIAVRKAMGAHERHPAFHEMGMVGWHFDKLPAWERIDDDSGIYRVDPFPNGGEFVMLCPVHMGTANQQFTIWSRCRPEECLEQPLATESFHLRFHRRER